MKSQRILTAGIAAAICLSPLAGLASASPFASNRAVPADNRLLHLAQDNGNAQGQARPRRELPCDPGNPECNLPKQLLDGARKRKPLTEMLKPKPEEAPAEEQTAEPKPEEAPAQEQATEPRPEEAPAQDQTAEPKPEEAPAEQQVTEPAPEQAPAQQQATEPAPEQAPEQVPTRRQASEPETQQLQQQRQAEEPRRRPPEAQQTQERRRDDARPRDRDNRGGDFLAIMRDNRPAGELTDAELRLRIELFGQALQSGRIDGRMENRVRASLNEYQGELERRITATTGRQVEGLDANREARDILRDDRPASRMKDDQLRERISDTRTVLSLPGLDPRFENQLRDQLSGDRDELRSRVALAERPDRRERYDIRPGQRVDRRELRRDLLDARDQRRRRLSDPDYRIVIPNRPVQRRAPIATIPLAEAYDDQIVEQLMAPPAQPINRRYSLEEYRANPALRTLMPGIEVDTVKFGFNEDFLREEEIIKLDRIGEIIERIVAGNPDEVFLIEGHTDLVGSDAYNEDLSWRRAAAVRNALTEYFYIPAKNLEIVGYGEQYPRIPTEYEEPENRRSTIRRITPILYGQR